MNEGNIHEFLQRKLSFRPTRHLTAPCWLSWCYVQYRLVKDSYRGIKNWRVVKLWKLCLGHTISCEIFKLRFPIWLTKFLNYFGNIYKSQNYRERAKIINKKISSNHSIFRYEMHKFSIFYLKRTFAYILNFPTWEVGTHLWHYGREGVKVPLWTLFDLVLNNWSFFSLVFIYLLSPPSPRVFTYLFRTWILIP